MDRLHKTLITVICLLLFVNVIIIYNVWAVANSIEPEEIPGLSKKVMKEMDLATIDLNNEMQVINGSGQPIWIRAHVDIPEIAGQKTFKLISDTISDKPDKKELKRGVWTLNKDGYYYYNKPVSPGEQSLSIFKEVRSIAEVADASSNQSVQVKAQAIQTNWVSDETKDAVKAFQIFGYYRPVEEYVGNIL